MTTASSAKGKAESSTLSFTNRRPSLVTPVAELYDERYRLMLSGTVTP